MKPFCIRPRWRIVLLILLTMLLIGLGRWAFHRPPPPPPAVIVFPLPYQIPSQKAPLPDRWIPRNWGWAWRLKEAALGRAKPITLGAAILDLSGPEETAPAYPPLRTPAYTNKNGLRIWILPDSEMARLRGSIHQALGYRLVSSPRVTTTDGGQASLFTGNSVPVGASQVNVGLVIDLLPRVRPDSTDLTTVITLSETVTNQPDLNTQPRQTSGISIRTNFAAAVRIQIPKGSGIFLLDTSEGQTNRKRIGVIISATLPKPKK
jgi:hypothetical protein